DLMNGFSSDFRDYADDDRFEMFTVENGGFRHLVFNNTRAPFDDVRARKAVALALDPTELVQTLLSDPEQVGSTTLFSDESPYYDAALGLPDPDLEEAQKLVDELIADGVDMSFTIVPAAIPESIRSAEYVQLTLQQLEGVTVDIEQVQIQDWRLRTQGNDDFDITFYLGIYDINPVASTFTNLFEKDGTDNIQNSSSPEMTAALDELRTATSEEEKAAALTQVQEIYVEEVPIYSFGFDNRIFFHSAEVQGFEAFGRGSILSEELFRTE
ncbi:MAG TPA: ABC transporter substrate-binding protein, partial [Microbacterium sp.]|nr:ABC transporter substrate-binding protein [Microbacterium sp.]